ncbi:hypothetical protein DIPPA_21914 [Diplonema papillatum]|nr:hypothetical protein DIPPA_21914 [Diplonema papillatum]
MASLLMCASLVHAAESLPVPPEPGMDLRVVLVMVLGVLAGVSYVFMKKRRQAPESLQVIDPVEARREQYQAQGYIEINGGRLHAR